MLVAIVIIRISHMGQKASAIDSVGQVLGGASLNATKKLRRRLTLAEARLINSNAL
jgi:hypothetical protein